MLIIRNEQMNALGKPRLKDFERRLLTHCRTVVEKAGLPLGDDALTAQVKRGLAVGLRFFTTEREIARYCEIVLLKIGGWYDDHPPAVNEILTSDALGAEVRLRNFEYWISNHRG